MLLLQAAQLPRLTNLTIGFINDYNEMQRLPSFPLVKQFRFKVADMDQSATVDLDRIKCELQFIRRIPALFPELEGLYVDCEMKKYLPAVENAIHELGMSDSA